MTTASLSGRTPARRSVAAYAVIGLMLVLMPVLSVQGPAHTTPMDAVSALFILGYACYVLARRPPFHVPMLLPFWTIMLGSFIGLYPAHDPGRALLQMSKEIYLFAWFVCTTNFIIAHCDTRRVTAIWVVTAASIGVLMAIDFFTGTLGGLFSAEQRAAGTFENPNMAGNYMVMSFFLAWALGQSGMRWCFLAMPAVVAGGIATASNGMQISLTAGSLVALALYANTRQLAQLAGVVAIAAGLGIFVFGVGHETIANAVLQQVDQGKRNQFGGTAMEGASERLPLWLDAAHSFQETPTGVGAGNFNRQGGAISGDFHGAHNTYVGMLVERGPVGLCGWFGVLGAIALLLRRLGRAPLVTRALAIQPLYGAFAAIIVHSVTMEMFHFRHLWMLIAVIYAAVVQAQSGTAAMAAARGRALPPVRARGL